MVSCWTEVAAELGSGVAGLDKQNCRRRSKVASRSTNEPARGWARRAGGDGDNAKCVEKGTALSAVVDHGRASSRGGRPSA